LAGAVPQRYRRGHRSIAGQIAAFQSDSCRTSIQTEQSVVVAGYGALVVNNNPASIPDGFPTGAKSLSDYAGSDTEFTPLGIQKLSRDPASRTFTEAWTNNTVSSANSVPVMSADLSHVYTVGARNGCWTMEAVGWESGESAFHWVTGSNRYNSLFSGMNIDNDGRIIHTTMFGILRYDFTETLS
jgi:hypothetical protein